MSDKKFCMECGSELIVAADGGVAICAKCGKSYTFAQVPSEAAAPASSQADAFLEQKSKVYVLAELGKIEEAREVAKQYLDQAPQDYRAYLLYCAVELDLYRLDPVEAVIDRNWLEIREKLSDGIKIAKHDEREVMKAECGEYCTRADNVVQMFYDMIEFEKLGSQAPVDPEIQINYAKELIEKEIAQKKECLDSLCAEHEALSKKDVLSEILNRPLPSFFIAKRIEIKRRNKLCYDAVAANTKEMEAVADNIEKYKQDIEAHYSAIAELDKKLEAEKKQYLKSLEQYNEAVAA